MTVNCPGSNQLIAIPRATAVPPPLPAEPKATQQSQTRSRQQTSGLKKLGTMAGVAVVALVVAVVALVLWFAYDSSKSLALGLPTRLES